MSRIGNEVELAVHADDVEGLRWPSVAITDGSPDPVRVAVPLPGLPSPGCIDLPLDEAAATRVGRLLRFRRFGFRVLLPAYAALNVMFLAAQVFGDFTAKPLDHRIGWVVLGFNAALIAAIVVGVLRYRIRQLPRMRGDVVVVPAVHPAAARALQHLNEDGVVTVRLH